MAATEIVPQAAGLITTPAPASPSVDGSYIVVPANARLVLRFANTSGSIVTVTVDDPTSVTPANATAFNPDVAIAVPATTGVRRLELSGSSLARFRDPATGRVNLTYSAVASFTVEAFFV